MKNLHVVAAIALALAACSKPASIEPVESLVANPERLKELRAKCKADHAKVGDVQCNAAAEATRRRFMGDGKSPYANDPIPQSASPASSPTGSAAKD